MRSNKSLIRLSLVQGVYYLITGSWPIIHINSFLEITGPKTDLWLVRTVGVLITAIAISLFIAVWTKNIPPSIITLAILSALGLMLIDIIYVSNKTILPVYLLDACAELLLIALWFFFLHKRKT